MRSVQARSAFPIESLEGRTLFAGILPSAKAVAAKPPVGPTAVATLNMPAGTNNWFVVTNSASTQLEVRIGSNSNPPAYAFNFSIYSSLFISGNSGDDSVQLLIGNTGNPPSAFALNFDGKGHVNGDQFIILGKNNGNTVDFADGDQVAIGNYGCSYFNMESHAFYGGSGSDTINITGNDNPIAYGFGGNDYFNVTDGVFSPNYDLNTSFSNTTLSVSGNSQVTLGESQHLNLLLIGNGSTVSLATNNDVIRTNSMGIGLSATLDLGNGALIYSQLGTSVTAVAARIKTGYANGAWTGPGIRSSDAAEDPAKRHGLGMASAASIFGITAGQTRTYLGETVDSNTGIVRYTYYGDTDLDRGVSIVDFNRMSAKFGKAGGWFDGDFDYDDAVSIVDFNRLTANFGKSE